TLRILLQRRILRENFLFGRTVDGKHGLLHRPFRGVALEKSIPLTIGTHVPQAVCSKCDAARKTVVMPPAIMSGTCKKVDVELEAAKYRIFRISQVKIAAGYLIYGPHKTMTSDRPIAKLKNPIGKRLEVIVRWRQRDFRRGHNQNKTVRSSSKVECR